MLTDVSTFLLVESSTSGLYKLIGQFCRHVIGCRTQVAKVGRDWSSLSVGKVRSFCSFVMLMS